MKLNAPTQVFFIISLVLIIIAVLGGLGVISAVAGYSFWLAVAGWAVLMIGCVMKGA